MGFLSNLIKKLLPFRDVITVLIIGFRIAWFASMFVFAYYAFGVLLDIYNMIRTLMDMTSSGTVLAGTDAHNNFSSVAWTALHQYGVIEVLQTYLPIIYSNLAMYLTYAGMKLMINVKDKIISEMRRMANLGLGGS